MDKLTMRIQKQDNLNDVYFEDVEGPGGGRHYIKAITLIIKPPKAFLLSGVCV